MSSVLTFVCFFVCVQDCRVKNCNVMKYPLALDMAPYLEGYAPPPAANTQQHASPPLIAPEQLSNIIEKLTSAAAASTAHETTTSTEGAKEDTAQKGKGAQKGNKKKGGNKEKQPAAAVADGDQKGAAEVDKNAAPTLEVSAFIYTCYLCLRACMHVCRACVCVFSRREYMLWL